MTAALANELVHLYKGQFGRGPTSAHAFFVGPAERKLLEIGEHQRLREMRTLLPYGLHPQGHRGPSRRALREHPS